MEHERPTFGQWLRRQRERDGRSARALSLAAGLEKSYVERVEAGQIKRPQREMWAPLARELHIPDPVMAAAVGGFFPDDAPQPSLPPARPAPEPVIDPALPAYIQDALRPLVGKLPDDDVRATGRILAGIAWKSRAELEAELGPTKYRSPSQDVRDGSPSGNGAPRDGTVG